jgi:hypothetical protein
MKIYHSRIAIIDTNNKLVNGVILPHQHAQCFSGLLFFRYDILSKPTWKLAVILFYLYNEYKIGLSC